MSKEIFENGEYFIYVNGDINGRYELGKVKRPNNDGTGYFCYYHEGSTCANTPVECMHKLVNSYVIKEEYDKLLLKVYWYLKGIDRNTLTKDEGSTQLLEEIEDLLCLKQF